MEDHPSEPPDESIDFSDVPEDGQAGDDREVGDVSEFVDVPEAIDVDWKTGGTVSYAGVDHARRREDRRKGGAGFGIAALIAGIIVLLSDSLLIAALPSPAFRRSGMADVVFGVAVLGSWLTIALSAPGLVRPLSRRFAIAARICGAAAMLICWIILAWYDPINVKAYLALVLFLILPVTCILMVVADGMAGA